MVGSSNSRTCFTIAGLGNLRRTALTFTKDSACPAEANCTVSMGRCISLLSSKRTLPQTSKVQRLAITANDLKIVQSLMKLVNMVSDGDVSTLGRRVVERFALDSDGWMGRVNSNENSFVVEFFFAWSKSARQIALNC
jgi:hypothetical protein